MLKHIWKLRWQLLALFLILCACIYLITLAPSYRDCTNADEGKKTYQQANGFFANVGQLVVCETATLNDNTGALTALGTLAVAFFTLTLWLITGKAVDLAREEFVSSYRPRLRMRHLKIKMPERGKPFEVEFQMSNIGDTPARLTKVDLTIRVIAVVERREDGQFRGYGDFTSQELIERADMIAPGSAAPITHVFSANYGTDWKVSPSHLMEAAGLAIIGVVSYEDDREITRQTAFYRFSTEDPNRFRFGDFDKARKRDREYED